MLVSQVITPLICHSLPTADVACEERPTPCQRRQPETIPEVHYRKLANLYLDSCSSPNLHKKLGDLLDTIARRRRFTRVSPRLTNGLDANLAG